MDQFRDETRQIRHFGKSHLGLPRIGDRQSSMARSGKSRLATIVNNSIVAMPVDIKFEIPSAVSESKRKLIYSINNNLSSDLVRSIGHEILGYRDDVLKVVERWANIQSEKERLAGVQRRSKRRLHGELSIKYADLRNKSNQDIAERGIEKSDNSMFKENTSAPRNRQLSCSSKPQFKKLKRLFSPKPLTHHLIQLENTSNSYQNPQKPGEKKKYKPSANSIKMSNIDQLLNNMSTADYAYIDTPLENNKRVLRDMKQESLYRKYSDSRVNKSAYADSIGKHAGVTVLNGINVLTGVDRSINNRFDNRINKVSAVSTQPVVINLKYSPTFMNGDVYMDVKSNIAVRDDKKEDMYAINSSDNFEAPKSNIYSKPIRMAIIKPIFKPSTSLDKIEHDEDHMHLDSEKQAQVQFFQPIKKKPGYQGKTSQAYGQLLKAKLSNMSQTKIANSSLPAKDLLIFRSLDGCTKDVRRDYLYDFMDKINLANFCATVKQKAVSYTAYIGNGNNAEIIKEAVKRRWWFKIVDKAKDAQLVWSQKDKSHKMNDLSQARQFDGKEREFISISSDGKATEDYWKQLCDNKTKKFKQHTLRLLNTLEGKEFVERCARVLEPEIIEYCIQVNFEENRLLNLGIYDTEDMPIIKYGHDQLSVPIALISNTGTRPSKTPLSSMIEDTEACATVYLHNHIGNHELLSDKKDLLLSLKSGMGDPFDIIPYTILLHRQNSIEELSAVYNHRECKGLPNVWILKPAVNSNRGRGIEVVRKLSAIEKYVKDSRSYVIAQLYIIDPLLYKGRKFDIRMFMLITWVNGSLKAYFFEDGYVRTAACQFNLTDLDDQFIHLTNEAIQKNCDDFSKFEKANKLTTLMLEEYIKAKVKKEYSFERDTFQNMKVDNKLLEICSSGSQKCCWKTKSRK